MDKKKQRPLTIIFQFWTKYVPNAWEQEPLDHKLAWIVFGTYTIALLTLIELFVFKK